MAYIITISLKQSKKEEKLHNPRNKKSGKCPLLGNYCSDITGKHHSFLETKLTLGEIKKEYKEFHITRIEEVSYN